MKEENFIRLNSKMLKEAFSGIKANIFFIILIDALFYLSSIFAITFWWQRVQQKLGSFALPQGEITQSVYPQLLQTLSATKSFFYILLLSIILLVLLIIVLASIAKSIIWAMTSKEKISIHLVSRLLVLNLIWMASWILLIFIAAFLSDANTAPLYLRAIMILGIYFSAILYSFFVREPRLAMMKKSIIIGVAKFKYFAVPFAGFLSLFYIIQWLSIRASFAASGYFYSFLLLADIALLRYFFLQISGEIKKQKL